LYQGIVGRNIAIAPWSILLEDLLLAMVDLLVLVALAMVEQMAEVLAEAFVEAAAEQLAEASVVGTTVLHLRTWSSQQCHELEEHHLAKLDHCRRPCLHRCVA
tara:strand:- start:164 stop:472 length:309 start_codon:yes stop_codon:yes gene_type:complete